MCDGAEITEVGKENEVVGRGGLDDGRGEAVPRGNGPIRKSDWGREENRGRGRFAQGRRWSIS